MKTPLLPASFAVAVMASAADLQDPAIIIEYEWNKHTANPPVFSVDPSLKGTMEIGGLTLGSAPRATAVPRKIPSPHRRPIPRDRIYDAPNDPVPPALPDNMPRGTKEWKYGGGTYYIVPLVPAPEK